MLAVSRKTKLIEKKKSQRWKPVLNVQLHPSVLDVILDQKAMPKRGLPLPLPPPPHHPNEAKAD